MQRSTKQSNYDRMISSLPAKRPSCHGLSLVDDDALGRELFLSDTPERFLGLAAA